MNEWMEKFLAGTFAMWFAAKRGHAPDKRDRQHGQSVAESARYAFNALLKSK